MDGCLNAKWKGSFIATGSTNKVIKLTKRRFIQTLQMFHTRLVKNSSCLWCAYPIGWSFSHVLPRLFNYQTAPMCVKPPIEVVCDWCGLLRISCTVLGVQVANSPLHLVNTSHCTSMSIIFLMQKGFIIVTIIASIISHSKAITYYNKATSKIFLNSTNPTNRNSRISWILL